jgi:hypothetical protein
VFVAVLVGGAVVSVAVGVGVCVTEAVAVAVDVAVDVGGVVGVAVGGALAGTLPPPKSSSTAPLAATMYRPIWPPLKRYGQLPRLRTPIIWAFR